MTCGKEFMIYEDQIKRGRGKFCSKKCVSGKFNHKYKDGRYSDIGLKEYQKRYGKKTREKYRPYHTGYMREYRLKPEVKEKIKEYYIVHNHSEKARINHRKYRKTEKGKINKTKTYAKRRNMKWIYLFGNYEVLDCNIFPEEIEIADHHVDGKWFVVPLPKNIHIKCNSGTNIQEHLQKANDWVEFYYGINPTEILSE